MESQDDSGGTGRQMNICKDGEAMSLLSSTLLSSSQ